MEIQDKEKNHKKIINGHKEEIIRIENDNKLNNDKY
jgi:hypothetical protein